MKWPFFDQKKGHFWSQKLPFLTILAIRLNIQEGKNRYTTGTPRTHHCTHGYTTVTPYRKYTVQVPNTVHFCTGNHVPGWPGTVHLVLSNTRYRVDLAPCIWYCQMHGAGLTCHRAFGTVKCTVPGWPFTVHLVLSNARCRVDLAQCIWYCQMHGAGILAPCIWTLKCTVTVVYTVSGRALPCITVPTWDTPGPVPGAEHAVYMKHAPCRARRVHRLGRLRNEE